MEIFPANTENLDNFILVVSSEPLNVTYAFYATYFIISVVDFRSVFSSKSIYPYISKFYINTFGTSNSTSGILSTYLGGSSLLIGSIVISSVMLKHLQ